MRGGTLAFLFVPPKKRVRPTKKAGVRDVVEPFLVINCPAGTVETLPVRGGPAGTIEAGSDNGSGGHIADRGVVGVFGVCGSVGLLGDRLSRVHQRAPRAPGSQFLSMASGILDRHRYYLPPSKSPTYQTTTINQNCGHRRKQSKCSSTNQQQQQPSSTLTPID